MATNSRENVPGMTVIYRDSGIPTGIGEAAVIPAATTGSASFTIESAETSGYHCYVSVFESDQTTPVGDSSSSPWYENGEVPKVITDVPEGTNYYGVYNAEGDAMLLALHSFTQTAGQTVSISIEAPATWHV